METDNDIRSERDELVEEVLVHDGGGVGGHSGGVGGDNSGQLGGGHHGLGPAQHHHHQPADSDVGPGQIPPFRLNRSAGGTRQNPSTTTYVWAMVAVVAVLVLTLVLSH
jgi:hypothetical protein